MKIAYDRNQMTGRHIQSNEPNHKSLQKAGHELIEMVLPYGDYIEYTDRIDEIVQRRGSKLKKIDLTGSIPVAVDRKASIGEIAQNVSSTAYEHQRFHDEIVLAHNCGCKFYVLIEDDDITDLVSLVKWRNPRTDTYFRLKAAEKKGRIFKRPLPKRPPVSGEQLSTALATMAGRYGVKFVFCKHKDAAAMIVKLLEHRG